ncbi:MAG: F0F1 ATP synthase subunit B [Deltaproteobacteria bacterium]|nr:F0F1 ATP synthase subunit B [Deltaproteobacteria bacterium]
MPRFFSFSSTSCLRNLFNFLKIHLPLIALIFLYGGLVYASSGGEGATGHGAAAAHGGETTARLLDLLYRSINFIIFFVVLFILLRKPLKQGLASRRDSIERELQELETKKEEAKKEYQALEKRIANIKGEREAILAEFKAEGEKEQRKIVENAQKVASRIVEQTQITIQQEIQKANLSLRQELAEMAVQMAEDILKKNITENDQKVLIGEYLAKVVTH